MSSLSIGPLSATILYLFFLSLLVALAGFDASPLVQGISSTIAHVDGGKVLYIAGSFLPQEGIECLFRFKPNRVATEHRAKAVYVNSTCVTCTVPRSPYRLVLHHQHRLPWPGCKWEERCMGNSFSLSLNYADAPLPASSFNLSYYLGSFEAPPSFSLAATSKKKDDPSLQLQRELFALNHPRDCSVVPVMLFPTPTHQSQCTGIGMVFYAKYVTALKEAYEQGRALVFKDPFFSYCYFSDREHEDEKYLLEPSNCTVQNINKALATEFVPNAAWFSSIKKPGHFASRDVAWFRHNFVRYLFRYTPSFQAHLANVSARIQFQEPCIGVHLRRGERGNIGFTTVWLAEYPVFDLTDAVRLLAEIKRQTNISNVFLATDEPSFFEDAKKLVGEYNIIHDNFYKRAEKGRDCIREHIAGCTPGLTAAWVTRTILSELHFLSRCSAMVATMTSTFSKLATDHLLSYHELSTIVSLE